MVFIVRSLVGSLTHLDAADRRLLRVDNDRVAIATKHRRHREPVLLMRRLAQVDDPPAHARESPLKRLERLLEARLALLLLLLGTGCLQVLQGAGELFVVFFLGLPTERYCDSVLGRRGARNRPDLRNLGFALPKVIQLGLVLAEVLLQTRFFGRRLQRGELGPRTESGLGSRRSGLTLSFRRVRVASSPSSVSILR